MKKVMMAVAALMLVTVALVATGFKKNDVSISGATGGNPSTFVDLGLPSGTLWAKWNVGASYPEEGGDLFTWGETKKPKSGKDVEYTRLGQILEERDDAATANWGKNWRTPTYEEWAELKRYCSTSWTAQGCHVIGPNGNSIFLPGFRYWSATFIPAWAKGIPYATAYFTRVICGHNVLEVGDNHTGYTSVQCFVRPVLKYTKDEYMMMSIEKQLGN